MLGIEWVEWKHAMVSYADAKKIKIPPSFDAKTNRCGKSCAILLKRIQHHAGLAQDGILGPRTANVLRNWFGTSDLSGRTRLGQVCQWGVDHAAAIHYVQLRPMNLLDCVLPISEDCSKYTTFGCYWAGLPDPNGLHYAGEGNTSTLYAHLQKISMNEVHMGDLVIWGGAYIQPLSHVAVFAEHGGADPEIYSMGSEIGPLKLPLSAESRYHYGLARTFHRINT